MTLMSPILVKDKGVFGGVLSTRCTLLLPDLSLAILKDIALETNLGQGFKNCKGELEKTNSFALPVFDIRFQGVVCLDHGHRYHPHVSIDDGDEVC